ncbi:hypothetical protein [Hyalangium minutum]|uniref:hypothetical protein n=1 Tax=Hyalangium minutum TaxID=394096 RepID=UPI0005C51003|nr:hypothetical protein [Hyalangium minutum]
MQLPIERWTQENNLPKEARVALEEATRCFKAGAYRAALLFSYLGWSLTVRLRILSAKCPTGIIPAQWNQILLDLQNEDTWDSQTFDCTQMRSPREIFHVSDDLRQQVKYWRDRRNDCAHFKNDEIASAHVEAFWLFLQSNAGKFIPNGSIADILERLERHFDPNLTPPGASMMPIVAMIPTGVPQAELPHFWSEVVSHIGQGPTVWQHLNAAASVFEAVFELHDGRATTSLSTFLAADANLLVALLRQYPSRVLLWAEHASLIRQLWRSHLFEGRTQDLPIYAALLRNGLIPAAELPEANQWVVTRINNSIPAALDLPDLEKHGLIQALQDHAFNDGYVGNFEWANSNPGLIAWLIQQYPMTDEIAQRLCSTFEGLYYPHRARDSLRALFAANGAKKAEFLAAAANAGSTPPKTLV